MQLYKLVLEEQEYYAEARTMAEAVALWQKFRADVCERDPEEEPDQVTLIQDAPIIRENMEADQERFRDAED